MGRREEGLECAPKAGCWGTPGLPSPAAFLASCLLLTGPFLSPSCVCASVPTLPTPPPTSK